ncbi:MAG: UDP-glucose:undecaprenyl-phosphate glucose-1-phosphate transferase [Catillopecten margaritatus gill symbiont]|uniref:UDP-glucose:undecaprenyl-phosphate glucose-1-phosphate transferase n=1 Tax=Catillopecten margaritatus gill symbiont TaxID=3083288 RepID=A0AAU6PFU8_9GAMM
MSALNLLIKRIFDIYFGLLGLICVLPLFALIAIGIKLDSKGPVFFRQARLGVNKKPYYIYKFRSMSVGAEQMKGGIFNTENDSRVTGFGGFLRDTSLDELPQFINIVRGEMSFVGPRPPVTYELGDLDDLTPEFEERFRMKPGVTGLAQVSGRNELSWDEKVAFDNQYIELFKKWGILIDIKLILLTIVRVVKNEGSHEIAENVEKDRQRINKKD